MEVYTLDEYGRRELAPPRYGDDPVYEVGEGGCFVCRASAGPFAVPFYEDLILPTGPPATPFGEIITGWTGEHACWEACGVCYALQSKLTDVVTKYELADMAAADRLYHWICVWTGTAP